jgi:hypothetical protein
MLHGVYVGGKKDETPNKSFLKQGSNFVMKFCHLTLKEK